MIKPVIKKIISPSGLLSLSACFVLLYNINNFKNLEKNICNSIDNISQTIDENSRTLENAITEKDSAINESFLMRSLNYVTGNKLTKKLDDVVIEEDLNNGIKEKKIYSRIDSDSVSAIDEDFITEFGQKVGLRYLKTGQCILAPRIENGRKVYGLTYRSYKNRDFYRKEFKESDASLSDFDIVKGSSIEVERIISQKEAEGNRSSSSSN